MHANQVLKSVSGAMLVYAFMAACSGTTVLSGATADGGTGSSPVPNASADQNQSGSRIKAMTYAGADGSKQFVGWHDSQLDVDCAFSTASDGSVRCLPAGSTFFFYSDASCTKRLVPVSTGCAAGKYATVVDEASKCGVKSSATHLYALGAKYTGSKLYTSVGMCDEATAPGSDFYAIGDEVDPSTFVAGTLQTEP